MRYYNISQIRIQSNNDETYNTIYSIDYKGDIQKYEVTKQFLAMHNLLQYLLGYCDEIELVLRYRNNYIEYLIGTEEELIKNNLESIDICDCKIENSNFFDIIDNDYLEIDEAFLYRRLVVIRFLLLII